MACLTDLFVGIHNEVCGFCYKNSKHKQPTFDWTIANGASVLRAYPAGVSRTVLLTELEHKWRSAVRRGENAGKLKRVLASAQLALHETLDGTLSRLDEFRCRLESDGAAVDLILHRQCHDLAQHCRHYGIDPLHERRVQLAQCRLNHNPVMLLPTPLIHLALDMTRPADCRLVTDVLLPMYRAFSANPCAEQAAGREPRALFCQVTAIGPPTQHPRSPGPYRLVRLELCPQFLLQTSEPAMGVGAATGDARKVYLLLYDDKVP